MFKLMLTAAAIIMPMAANAAEYALTVTGKVTGQAKDDLHLFANPISAGDDFAISYFYDIDKVTKLNQSMGFVFFPFDRVTATINGSTLSLDTSFYQYISFRDESTFRAGDAQHVNLQYSNYPAGQIITATGNFYAIDGSLYSSASSIANSIFDRPGSYTLATIREPYLQSAGLGGVYNTSGSPYLQPFLSVQMAPTTITVGAVAAAVPEPATWAMMIMGFGMIGAAMRRRKQSVRVVFA